MSYAPPSVADFKAYFTRDFPYGTDPATTVLDADIQKALDQAGFNFNESFFSTLAQFKMAYLYLAAHYLVLDLQMASQGVAAQFNWLEQSKSVGSVSQSFSIPQRILDNPEFSYLTKTPYGAKYLTLILPQITGQVFAVRGRTHA